MSNNPTAFQRLRAFLNRAIKGKFTDATLHALAEGDNFNIDNILALKDNLFVATAERRFLDKIVARMGVVRPPGVGIDDDSFRNIAVSTTNKQLVSNVLLEVLELFYGEDSVKANVLASTEETYVLEHGMDLYIKQDGIDLPLRVEFQSQDFQNINQATSSEISSIISREALKGGYSIYATNFLDADAGKIYLQIFSGTRGPKSSIAITGGSSQNIFLFPALKQTTQIAGTQFTVTIEGSSVRYTWTGGADPGLQNIDVGDYVNIKYTPFPIEQSGSFVVTKIVPDSVTLGYFEISNPLVQTGGSIVLASANDLRFFYPKRNTLNDLTRFASVYEVNPYEVVVFLPATTRIVKRQLIGGWHLHTNGSEKSFLGSYVYDPKSGFPISKESVVCAQPLNAGQVYSVIPSTTSTDGFPDDQGYIVFDYGTSNQEGPIKYLGKPSSNTLLLDASYIFKKTHIAADITLVKSIKPHAPAIDGSDYPTYVTGTVTGRVKAEELSKALVAAGVFVSVVVVYPNGPGINSITDMYAGDIE